MKVDLDQLNSLIELDKDFFENLVAVFLKESEKIAINIKNTEEVSKFVLSAHTLNGMFKNLGLTESSELAEKFELGDLDISKKNLLIEQISLSAKYLNDLTKKESQN